MPMRLSVADEFSSIAIVSHAVGDVNLPTQDTLDALEKPFDIVFDYVAARARTERAPDVVTRHMA